MHSYSAIYLILFLIFLIVIEIHGDIQKMKLRNDLSTSTTMKRRKDLIPSTTMKYKQKPYLLTSPKNNNVNPHAMTGGHAKWNDTLNPKQKKLFDDYKAVILKKLKEKYRNIPSTFQPKPTKISTQVVSGMNYHYLVKIPSNKYAFVTIHHQAWRPHQHGNEKNVNVRNQTYDLTEISSNIRTTNVH